MVITWDPVAFTNIVFDLVILCLGVYAYNIKKGIIGLYVGAAFGLFAISYAMTILGYGNATTVLISVRVLGYLTVIVGLILLTRRMMIK
jgi:hypothetical protein